MGFNDPDIMEIGNGKLSLAEEKSHMSMWCILAAVCAPRAHVFVCNLHFYRHHHYKIANHHRHHQLLINLRLPSQPPSGANLHTNQRHHKPSLPLRISMHRDASLTYATIQLMLLVVAASSVHFCYSLSWSRRTLTLSRTRLWQSSQHPK
jgi:hypothetical protein